MTGTAKPKDVRCSRVVRQAEAALLLNGVDRFSAKGLRLKARGQTSVFFASLSSVRQQGLVHAVYAL